MINEQQEFLISRYDDPDLTDQQRRELDELLADHPDARDLLEQYKALDDRFDQWPNESQEWDLSDFAKQVNQKIDGGSEKSESKIPFWKILVPIAAAAMIAIVIWPDQSQTTHQNNLPIVTSHSQNIGVVQPMNEKQPAVHFVKLSSNKPTKPILSTIVISKNQTLQSEKKGGIIVVASPLRQSSSFDL